MSLNRGSLNRALGVIVLKHIRFCSSYSRVASNWFEFILKNWVVEILILFDTLVFFFLITRLGVCKIIITQPTLSSTDSFANSPEHSPDHSPGNSPLPSPPSSPTKKKKNHWPKVKVLTFDYFRDNFLQTHTPNLSSGNSSRRSSYDGTQSKTFPR